MNDGAPIHWVPECWYLGFVSNNKIPGNPIELLRARQNQLRVRQAMVITLEGAGWPWVGSIVFLGRIDVI